MLPHLLWPHLQPRPFCHITATADSIGVSVSPSRCPSSAQPSTAARRSCLSILLCLLAVPNLLSLPCSFTSSASSVTAASSSFRSSAVNHTVHQLVSSSSPAITATVTLPSFIVFISSAGVKLPSLPLLFVFLPCTRSVLITMPISLSAVPSSSSSTVIVGVVTAVSSSSVSTSSTSTASLPRRRSAWFQSFSAQPRQIPSRRRYCSHPAITSAYSSSKSHNPSRCCSLSYHQQFILGSSACFIVGLGSASFHTVVNAA